MEIPIFNANNVDPDRTPRSAASDLGLNCLPMSLFWETRHKWVKLPFYFDTARRQECFACREGNFNVFLFCFVLFCFASFRGKLSPEPSRPIFRKGSVCWNPHTENVVLC